MECAKSENSETIELIQIIVEQLGQLFKLKQTKALVKKNEKFVKSILNSLDENICVLNKEGKIVSVNNCWEKFARENGNITLKNAGIGTNYLQICELACGEDFEISQKVKKGIENVISGLENNFTIEYPCNSKDEKRFFLLNCTPLDRKNGSVVISHKDITKRKEMEEKLRINENRLALALEATNDGLWELNLLNNELYCSPRCEKMVGFEEGELINMYNEWIGRIHPNDFDKVMKTLDKHFGGETPFYECEYRIKTKQNNWLWILSRGKVIEHSENGKPSRAIGTQSDITERKLYEEEIQRLSKAIEQSNVAIVITDIYGKIEYANSNFTKITGYSINEIIGKSSSILKSGKHSKEFYQNMWETINSGNEWKGEILNKKKNGEYFWDNVRISPVFDEYGKIIQFLSILEDITIQKQLQEQLLQSQKMEVIGKLAGGIVHDFNNLLTVILGSSELLILKTEKNNNILKEIEQIKFASEKAKSLTRQLLTFTREQIFTPKPLQINSTIKELKKILTRLISEDISIFLDLDENLKMVNADPTKIEQVILNLVINASESINRNGKITIKTQNVVFDKENKKNIPALKDGDYICFSVEDNGDGMTEEIQKHIFEPFFTTKGLGKGTGLGLTVVNGIIKQHEGWINIHSEIGNGTTFKIYLPAILDFTVEEIKNDNLNPNEFYGNGEKILIAEDDNMVARFIETLLSDKNYVVFKAKSVSEALEIFSNENKNFDLVFSDIILPDGNGINLVDRLISQNKNLKILLTSGYTDDKAKFDLITQKGFYFINKPYSINDLLKLIKQILQNRKLVKTK